MQGISQPFGPLHEGMSGAFFPEVAYVRQADKVLFLLGGKSLTESVESVGTIVESEEQLELVERDGKKFIKDGRYFVEGTFQRSDVKNANGRTYGRKIWDRLIANQKSPVQESVKSRSMLGHVEHPSDGRTNGKEGALVTTKLTLKEDGVVWGQAELLNTPFGEILQEYTRKKIRWGVSSRGNGSVDDSGKVNESDYMVETWDAVMRPSTPGAYPNLTKDSKIQSEADATAEETMTTEAKDCVEQARFLVSVSVTNLNESEQLKLTADLIALSGSANSLARANAMQPSIAYDVQDWLTKKLKEISEMEKTVSVTAQINEALNEIQDEEPDKRMQAFNRVIGSMQRRVSEALSETESLREKVNETGAQLQEMTGERDEALTRLLEAEIAVEEGNVRFSVAVDTLAHLSVIDVANPVEEAVEEAIEQVPALGDYREVLNKAEDVAKVEELIESLLPVAVAAKPVQQPKPILEAVSRPPQASSRLTLPKGSVVSESSIKASPSTSSNPSSGARMAGKVLSRLNGPPSKTP